MTKNGEIVKPDKETEENFYSFFTNVIKNLSISRSLRSDPLMRKIQKDPILKALFKYQNHPSIIAIQNNHRKDEVFKYSEFTEDDIKIGKMNMIKGS